MQAGTKERILAFAGFCTIGCLVSLYLGQDANFDLLNYHLHNAWALAHHRWTVDTFTAGIHTYFNPLLDLPYYLLFNFVLAERPAILVALSGLPYGFLLFFIYLISVHLANYLNIIGSPARCGFILSMVCLGGSGAATWSQIGTTTNEVTNAVFVLAALYQLLKNVCCPSVDRDALFRRHVYAGSLLGIAGGLKLTAIIYAPGSAIVILLMSGDIKIGIKSSFIFSVSWIVSFLAAYGFWGWHLYEMTGNPFFPLFNNVFHSGWMASISWRDIRFIPRNFVGWIFYPFFWLVRDSTLIAELPFRDGRLAFTYVGIALWCLLSIKRSININLANYARPINALAIFIVISYAIWLLEFSILRYTVVLECMGSIFIVLFTVLLIREVLGESHFVANFCAMVISLLLIAWTHFPQWGRVPISENILKIQVPPIKEGSLIVFADNPMSFLSLPLSRQYKDLHFVGIPRALANGESLNKKLVGYGLSDLIRREIAGAGSNISVLFYVRNVPPDANIAPFGLETDLASCQIGRSSVFWDFYVCRVRLSNSLAAKNNEVIKFKLTTREVGLIHGARMHFDWTKNGCAEQASNDSANIKWMSVGDGASLYVSSSRFDKSVKLIVRGGAVGEVSTGQWINAGQHYVLKNAAGQSLADADIGYVRCN